ncbi:MAG TPA: 50S ribosomal protein L10 [Gemmataceae bacterium]|jgi:large subunit ribosomal protein L10|nr:50S ribosomal protein L10 [Gemmataceae bacterium]
MSKQIKQLEMDALQKTFHGVSDMVVLSSEKLSCQGDHQFRTALRKKNIRLLMVKNSLARRVFGDLGIKVEGYWSGSTIVAWGAGSLAELSREIETQLKRFDKVVKVKGAVSEKQAVAFRDALKMPTKAEAIGRVVGLLLSPASRLVSQILAPAANVAGQIKTLAERKPEETPAEAAAPASPAAG